MKLKKTIFAFRFVWWVPMIGWNSCSKLAKVDNSSSTTLHGIKNPISGDPLQQPKITGCKKTIKKTDPHHNHIAKEATSNTTQEADLDETDAKDEEIEDPKAPNRSASDPSKQPYKGNQKNTLNQSNKAQEISKVRDSLSTLKKNLEVLKATKNPTRGEKERMQQIEISIPVLEKKLKKS